MAIYSQGQYRMPTYARRRPVPQQQRLQQQPGIGAPQIAPQPDYASNPAARMAKLQGMGFSVGPQGSAANRVGQFNTQRGYPAQPQPGIGGQAGTSQVQAQQQRPAWMSQIAQGVGQSFGLPTQQQPQMQPQPQPQPQYGFEPTRPFNPDTTAGKAWDDYSHLPNLSTNLNTAPNPMDYYTGLGPEAQNAIGNYLRGNAGRFDPNANPYLNQGQQYINNAPALPGAPQFGQNPTSYQGPQAPGYRDPTYDAMNFNRFDSSRVGGPGRGQYTDPRDVAAGIGGPQTDYDRLYSATQGQPVNRVGGLGALGPDYAREAGSIGTISREGNRVRRENIQGSNFEGNQGFGELSRMSTGALESGLGAARGLAAGGGFDVDQAKLDAAYKRQYEMAAQVGAEKAIGRGFSPSGGTVGGLAIGKELGSTMAQLAPEQARLMLEAASGRQRSQIAGMEGLQGIGGTAGGLAGERGKMLQGESQYLGDAALRQREQDIGQRGQEIDQRQQDIAQRGQNIDIQGQRITERGQDINRQLEGRSQDVTARGQDVTQRQQDITSKEGQARLALDVERLRNENYQSETQRMTGVGQLVNQMEEARANNDVAGYNAATQRLQTEYGYDADMARNQIAGYQAATQRGEVGQQAWAESNRLGLDYAQLQQRYDDLAANNVNMRNTNLIDVMRITGDQANERLRTVTSAMGDYGKTMQEGQIENMRNVYQQASMAAGILGDTAQASQFWTNAIMQATGQDREAYINMWRGWVEDQRHRNDNKFNWGSAIGAIGGGVGGFLVGGPAGAAAGAMAGGRAGGG